MNGRLLRMPRVECERSKVQIPGRAYLTQYYKQFATASTFYASSCVVLTLVAEMGYAVTRYTIRRHTASITISLVWFW